LFLTVVWIGILFFILVYFTTSNWDHFLEIRFPLILLISLGIYWVLKWLAEAIKNRKVYYLLVIGIILVLFFHLIQSDKWMFHEQYLYSNTEEKFDLVELIKETNLEIKKNDVIAIPQDPHFFNYYTDYNYILFNPETIKDLLRENRLQWAFERFGVTHVLGFDGLNQEIVKATRVKAIDWNQE